MKVYVSGPMTGYEDWNRPAFHAAAARLRSFGYEVVNPAELDYGLSDEDLAAIPHHVFLHRDIKALLDCDAIYLLPGWRHSKGATLESAVAKGTGIVEIRDPDVDKWRTFEGEPLAEEEPDTHPENPDEGVFAPDGPCSELTCPQHGERNRRDAETEGLDALARSLQAAGPDEFPEGYYRHLAEQSSPFADVPVRVDDSLPPNVIRVEAGNGGTFDVTFDLGPANSAPVVQRVECDAVEGDGKGNEWCSHGVQVAWADEDGGIVMDEDEPDRDPHLFPWQQAFARYVFGVLGGKA